MPRFKTTSEILGISKNKEYIRNAGIIAHVDHGKTTLSDSLLASAGLLSPGMAGTALALDYLEEEQKRQMTIKAANISLYHERDTGNFLINLIDTPGHVDFSGRVTRSLRAIDGAVVVVDAVEEVMVQTETVTRQALEERVRPVLYVNKIDRLIKELRLKPDQIQVKLARIISDFNRLIEMYGEPEFREKWKVSPAAGTLAFGSAKDRWGLTLGMVQEKGINFATYVDAYQNNADELQEVLLLQQS
jgi:elongation factor 2